ncbi:MAG TPA: glycosyltransferase family 87 protein, partial [Candidatus Acidoferrales bacterium]|nr:glycosyltransferase family 87 protein [Candidatus Acidoferrales bacterium]
MTRPSEPRPLSRRATVAAIAGFMVAVALLSYRASFYLVKADRPDGVHWVMQDFRDVVYFPARAFLDGRNPYNTREYMDTYPVWHPLALYTPLSLLVNAPFAMMPFALAWQTYFVFSLLLLTIMAALCLRVADLQVCAGRVAFVATAILLSRPGQMNFHLGQVGLQCALVTSLSVFYANRRPWIAAIALALSTIKPTYGAPLCVLLLCRGDVLLVTRALLLAAVPTALATIMLVERA